MDQKILQHLLDEIREIKRTMVTKDDLKKLKGDLIEEIKESEGFIVGSTDKNKAEKAVVEDHERRLTHIERKLAI